MIPSQYNSRNAKLSAVGPGNAEFAACTIIAKNYLPMARVLAESFQRHNPGCSFFALLMDGTEGCFQLEDEHFFIIEIPQLRIPNSNGLLFKYTVLEASTAVKPYLFECVFRDFGIKKLLYLDPDILIFRPLQKISELMEQSSIVLTPHSMSPYPDQEKPNDYDILQAGAFNLGFLALRNGGVASRFLTWWKSKVYHHCMVDFTKNLFVDQKWIDLVPAMFAQVHVLRDYGYNVAYWNLHEREIKLQGEEVLVNGEPCYFYHFSGFNPDKPSEISKHQTRYRMDQVGDARKLFARYQQLLFSAGWKQCRKWRYTHNFFSNGVRIPDSARKFYWSLGDKAEELGNPFLWLEEKLDAVPHPAAARVARRRSISQELAFGVNVVGYLTSEKGVGEAGRSNLRVIEATGVPFVANNFVDTGSLNLEKRPAGYSEKNPYSINLVSINADQVPHFVQSTNGYIDGRYNIGYWNWELSVFPPEWYGSFGYVDEVWVPSEFVRLAVGRVSTVPVTCVPLTIDPVVAPLDECDREYFRLSKETFIFLFLFDFHSFLERKNPFGLITAFKKAFGSRKDVQLLIKTTHAASEKAALRELERAAAGANVRIFDKVLSREETFSLMSVADCYVSLHRSEGFGLTLSEAMMCGKPVIATGYSGNADFMNTRNSFPVRYDLVEIEENHGPYKKGYLWAQPDLDQAGEFMHYVIENREETALLGKQARADVLASLHPTAVAVEARNRLSEIASTTGMPTVLGVS